MAKGSEQYADEVAGRPPNPSGKLKISLIELNQGNVLHRVHPSQYSVSEFNSSEQGNARFSPIHDEQGTLIPTLYAAATMDCALMETIFHDIPYTSGFKSFDKAKLRGVLHSSVRVEQTLQLVDLGNVALRRLGVERKQLIDNEKDQYPYTRKWAEAIHRQCLQAQGLSWISRQDDSARAVVLFGDRVPSEALQSLEEFGTLLDSCGYDAVLDLAERIGVNIVQGNI